MIYQVSKDHFDKEEFKKEEKIEIKEFTDNMFETMKKYGGIGLSANQVGRKNYIVCL